MNMSFSKLVLPTDQNFVGSVVLDEVSQDNTGSEVSATDEDSDDEDTDEDSDDDYDEDSDDDDDDGEDY